MDESSAITALEDWFKQHCDGTWEHRYGLTIQTTDNPGWLVTFKELRVSKDVLAACIGDLLRQYDAQISTDGTMVRVYSTSLQNVLIAAAILIGLHE
jgi:hypothetical protein